MFNVGHDPNNVRGFCFDEGEEGKGEESRGEREERGREKRGGEEEEEVELCSVVQSRCTFLRT